MTWTGIIFLLVGCNSGTITLPSYQQNNLYVPFVPNSVAPADGSTAYTFGCKQNESIGDFPTAEQCVKAVRAVVDHPQIKAISGGECSAKIDAHAAGKP